MFNFLLGVILKRVNGYVLKNECPFLISKYNWILNLTFCLKRQLPQETFDIVRDLASEILV